MKLWLERHRDCPYCRFYMKLYDTELENRQYNPDDVLARLEDSNISIK